MKYFYAAVCLLGLSSVAHAATIPAASCQAAAVTAAVNAAAHGDTVTIPPGTCTWTSTVSIGKAITLQGAGIGNTIILDAVNNSQIIAWTLVANRTSRMTGIEFRNAGGQHPGNNGAIVVHASSNDSRRMRIDHCDFEDLHGATITANNMLGVIDNNTWTGTPTNRFVNIWHNTWGGQQWGDGSWSAPSNFGSEGFLFVESNTITFLGQNHYGFIDGFGGARYVVRYNNINKAWVEAHGTDSTGRYRGTRAVEVYNNKFVGNDNTPYVVNLRSAVGLIHNNTIAGYQATPKFVMANYRMSTTYQPFGRADGSSPWDRNVGGVVVTALDQPCISGGSAISGDTPILPWAAGNNNQVPEPCYEWNNTAEGGKDIHYEAGHPNIKLGIHFFQNTPKPGYTPYPYPHPLATGGAPSGPSAPTNLRISSE